MYTCKDRFCPFCNWRRQLKYSKLVYEYLDELQNQKNLRYIFLTLTVPNCHIDDLRATIEHMNKSFQRMKEPKRFQNSILGYLRVLEYTVEKKRKDYIHPHFHILLAVEPRYFVDERYINQKEFLQMWRDATRKQNITQVDVRRIKSKNENFSDIDSAIIETVKYSVKHSDLVKRTNEDFYYLYTQTKNLRFISAGGILKEHLNLIKIDEDLINLKKENEALWIEIARLIYTWQNGEYCLKEIKPPKENKEQKENG